MPNKRAFHCRHCGEDFKLAIDRFNDVPVCPICGSANVERMTPPVEVRYSERLQERIQRRRACRPRPGAPFG